jgi:hypothetical protein
MKPTYSQFLDFFTDYYMELNKTQYKHSQYTHFPIAKGSTLRFGQAFLNKYYPDLSCPELFYEENAVKAYQIIFEKDLIDMKNLKPKGVNNV